MKESTYAGSHWLRLNADKAIAGALELTTVEPIDFAGLQAQLKIDVETLDNEIFMHQSPIALEEHRLTPKQVRESAIALASSALRVAVLAHREEVSRG